MPISRTQPAAADNAYGSPFRGPIDHSHQLAIDVTALTDAEIDALGYLKPGVPFNNLGGLVGVGDPVFGVSIEPIKVADGNTATLIAAASAAFQIAIGIEGTVNGAVIEDNLGRVLTAAERDGFNLAPCKVTLLA